MQLVMKLASLGHSARNLAAIKVRQPLAEAAFAVSNPQERQVPERYADLLADELNVKRVRVLSSAGEVVSYELHPLPKQLGQKYKAQYPAIRAALLALDPEVAGRSLLEGNPIQVQVGDTVYEILPEEVEVRLQAHSGLVVASEGGYLAALQTELTPELVREGLAREFVRRVQDLRKQADFDIADRIHLYYQASPQLAEAIQAHREYIMGETLTLELKDAPPLGNMVTARLEFDNQEATVGIARAQ
jgi:isoleucyl-tRNA synthetase